MEWRELLCGNRIRENHHSYKSSDLRTEFEKDYHRIVGSASFRRLQDKTQVFPLDKSDFVRTRLTHSLEVSSFAKSLGQNISEKIITLGLDKDFMPQYKADICDILQCAGLLHDIGNPPFGHFGETAIQEWFIKNLSIINYKGEPIASLLSAQMREDFYHFEGNAQAFRLVTKLHYLVDEHGMNLTKGLLGTMIKYPISSLEINKVSGNIKDKKMGYYYADRGNFDDIQKTLGTNGCRHPLTYLLETADDIAYRTADIEDAFKKGCITYQTLLAELKAEEKKESNIEYYNMVALLETKYQTAIEKNIEQPEDYAIHNWIVSLQGMLIRCATDSFISNYDLIMSGRYTKDLLSGTGAEHISEKLADIAYRKAFMSKPILKLEIAAETTFNFLLDRFVDAAIYYDTDVRLTDVQNKLMILISDNYKSIYRIYSRDKNEIERLYLRLLLITDDICGMTDSYAKALYQELNGIE